MWRLAVCFVLGCIQFEARVAESPPEPERRWTTVAIGDRTSCGITDAGELMCWGFGREGALGIGSTLATSPPQRIGSDADWIAITVGTGHTCGLRAGGALACWGTNLRGELGAGPVESIAVNPLSIVGATWTAIDAGNSTTCGLQTDGSLWCWGAGDLGQLGSGNPSSSEIPQRVGDATYRALSVGEATACAIRSDQSLWCWGANERGQIGDGTRGEIRFSPVEVSPGTTWRSVETSGLHTCGITTSGVGFCWGMNDDGRLGNGTVEETFLPRMISSAPVDALVVGTRHTCSLIGDRLACWGSSIRGGIAGVAARSVTTPQQLEARATRVFAGGDTTCILDAEDRLHCTGANGHGQTGGPAGEVHGLERTDDRTDWTAIFAHRLHACGSTADGRLHCWGFGEQGQIGDDATLDRQTPVAVDSGFTGVVMSTLGTGALRDGELWGWGIDVGGNGDFRVPTMFSPGITGIALGEFHGCALQADGELVCNGANRFGQLGDGTFTQDDPPVPRTVPGTWRAIYASAVTSCGTRNDNGLNDRLFCWGINFMVGSEPAGPDVADPRPVELPPLEVHQVSIGDTFACARIGDGEIHCWGGNFVGELGAVTENEVSQRPVRVGDRSDFLTVEAGEQHACAIASDRTLWCWGSGSQGELGEPLTERRALQQIGTDTDWAAIALGAHFTCALKVDGTRWCAGANDVGQLGNGRSWLTDFTAIR